MRTLRRVPNQELSSSALSPKKLIAGEEAF